MIWTGCPFKINKQQNNTRKKNKMNDKAKNTEAEASAALALQDKSHVTIVHDKTEDEKSRESKARALADKTKVAKNRKRLKYLEVRKKASKAVAKFAKKRATSELELKRAGEKQIKEIIDTGKAPDGVEEILAGYKKLGYRMIAGFTFGSVKMVDGEIKLAANFSLASVREDSIGEDERNPYVGSHRHSSRDNLNILLEPTEEIKSAWKDLEQCKEDIRLNNEMLLKAEDNLAELEELGEVAEARCLEAGMSVEELEQVDDLEDAFSKFLDDELENGGNLLALTEGEG
jgi:hypothetical protein